MDIKDQVCSFEQAKKLKELGVDYFLPQFCYNNGNIEFRPMIYDCPAFTVAELGVMLNLYANGVPVLLNDELVEFIDEVEKECVFESHLRARLLIKGIEIGFFKVNDINARLNS